MKRPAVFLSRDGVINSYAYNAVLEIAEAPARPCEFSLLPGVGEAIGSLNRLGIPVIVVSNQPGIAHGQITPHALDAINEEMRLRLAWDGARLDAVLYCRHHPAAALAEYRKDCNCRKPKPGLVFRAAQERNLDLARSFLIGDGLPDILAGRAAGVSTVLLSPDHAVIPKEFRAHGATPDFLAADLSHAVKSIAERLSGASHKFSPIAKQTLPDTAEPQESGPRLLLDAKSTHSARYLRDAVQIAANLDSEQLERVALLLRAVRESNGRLFLLNADDDAGQTSHAAADFRKLAGIEAYAVTDEGAPTQHSIRAGMFGSGADWLQSQRLGPNDMLLLFSSSAHFQEKALRPHFISALRRAREIGSSIACVVGGDRKSAGDLADVYVPIPVDRSEMAATHILDFQTLIWRSLVSHPALKCSQRKWESARSRASLSLSHAGPHRMRRRLRLESAGFGIGIRLAKPSGLDRDHLLEEERYS